MGFHRLGAALALAFLAGCSNGSTVVVSTSPHGGAIAAASSGAPLPELGRWEAQMVLYGLPACRELERREATFDERLAATYYDAEWVFYQLADYTGDREFLRCAEAAERIYRDKYVEPNRGNIPGFWNFSRGLTEDFLRTGDEASKRAVLSLAHDAAFARDSTSPSETVPVDASREVAYAIMAYLNAEDVGAPPRARLSLLVDHAFGHLDQWFRGGRAPYVRPFMAALTAQALIQYDERYGDPRTLEALTTAADWLWEHTWLPDAEAFMYTDRVVPSGGQEASPDLNLLIAPLYGWLYHKTGEERFAERGDAIFAGGVRGAYLAKPKQFNQSYRWSIRYVEWRGGGR